MPGYSLNNMWKKIETGKYKTVPRRKRATGPVPEHLQDPSKSYCDCGKILNSNNTSGMCSHCLNSKRRYHVDQLVRG